MKSRGNGDESNPVAELEIEEYNEIASYLDEYPVEFPSEMEIDKTIRILDTYMPDHMNAHLKQKSSGNSVKELFQLVYGEVAVFHKSYWLVCSMLLLFGYWLGTHSTTDPYMSVLFIVPVPFVLGLLEVFKGRDQGLMEIELTCKITAQQLMLTRLIVVLIGNMAFVVLLNLLISSETGISISWSAISLSYTQLMIAAGTSLWLAMRVRGGTAVSIFLIVWFALVWLVLSNPELKTLLQSIQPTVLIAMALCGVLLLISQIYEMARKYTLQTERGYSFDTDHG
ncbi:hypothetical protein ABGV40_30800 [Paenibacillus amylolyticus]|uniref:hypothetical protein n=1 Tax=Paenibacillus amylolyticus TaxID=1451 RepID=UPI00324207AB